MKKIIITLLLGFALVLSQKGVSEADSVFAPWFNESSAFDTWLLFSNGGTAISGSNVTLIARNTDGTVLGSTNPTIAANGNWVNALGTAITTTTGTGNTTGNLEIQGTDAVLNNLHIYIVVQGTASGAAGFVVPVYGVDVTTGNKYAPQ